MNKEIEKVMNEFDMYYNDDLYFVSPSSYFSAQKFIKKELIKAQESGREEERNHWINQTANEHDEKIREEMKKEVLESLPKEKYERIVVQDVIDLIEKL